MSKQTNHHAEKFTQGLPDGQGRVTIRAQDDGRSLPVLAVELRTVAGAPEGGSLSAEKLAGNIVRLLNGRAPEHRLDTGAGVRMFFHRNAGGDIVLSGHDGTDGVSKPLAAIRAAEAEPVRAQAALAALDNLVMASLCASGDNRRAPHHDGGGTRAHKPLPR